MKLRKRHLWWLLVPVMAGLLLAGFQFSLFYRQQAAVQQIEKLGGRVVTTHGDPRWIRWLIGGKSLRFFEQATVVNLSQNKVEDADLIPLRNLNGLQRLNLNETRITDDGLRHLEELTGLKALDLSGTQITGNGLEHLHKLTDLEYLTRTSPLTRSTLPTSLNEKWRHCCGRKRSRQRSPGTAPSGNPAAKIQTSLEITTSLTSWPTLQLQWHYCCAIHHVS